MASVLKYTRSDLASLKYSPVRPLDVISEEIGIPVDEIAKVRSDMPTASPDTCEACVSRGLIDISGLR